jgi:hypothetical protein
MRAAIDHAIHVDQKSMSHAVVPFYMHVSIRLACVPDSTLRIRGPKKTPLVKTRFAPGSIRPDKPRAARPRTIPASGAAGCVAGTGLADGVPNRAARIEFERAVNATICRKCAARLSFPPMRRWPETLQYFAFMCVIIVDSMPEKCCHAQRTGN